MCISIIGCDGLQTEDNSFTDYKGYVYGDRVMCVPLEINDIFSQNDINEAKTNLITMLCLSLGINNILKYLNSYDA